MPIPIKRLSSVKVVDGGSKIKIKGEINSGITDALKHIFKELGEVSFPDIKLYINSDGGDLSAAREICLLIKEYPGRVTGVVKKKAYSSAAVIFQACDSRKMSKNAEILFHWLSYEVIFSYEALMRNVKVEEVISNLRSKARNDRDLLMKIVGYNFKGDKDDLVTFLNSCKILRRDEAMHLGFVN